MEPTMISIPSVANMSAETEQWLLDHTKGLHVRLDCGDDVYTSMFIRLNGKPYIQTAGHILEKIDTFRKRKMPIREAMLFPTNGTEAIPFRDYLEDESTPLYYLNTDSIDIGLIPLSTFHDNQFNNEIFITEAHYSDLPLSYTGCILVGFPETHWEFEKSYININPAYVDVKSIRRPSGQPKVTPTRFYGKINVRDDFDVKGMSGGPIIGFLYDPEKDKYRYWIPALQSGWIPSKQLIFGTKLNTAIPTLMRHFGLE